jgi:hypothetical protein
MILPPNNIGISSPLPSPRFSQPTCLTEGEWARRLATDPVSRSTIVFRVPVAPSRRKSVDYGQLGVYLVTEDGFTKKKRPHRYSTTSERLAGFVQAAHMTPIPEVEEFPSRSGVSRALEESRGKKLWRRLINAITL